MTKKAVPKTSYQKGMTAETVAALFLRVKGYKIMERRFRTHLGEVDIIARKSGVMAFIEVKLRRTQEDAMEAIHRINQERVKRAAELYLARHTEYTVLETRFDAVIMAPGKLPQHITGAF